MSIIQQLEDLKEWAQDSTRYERRLAFRGNWRPSAEAGTILPEFDELSEREREYYRTGPWSTREDYSKGQLVQPGPGRQGYNGESYTKDPDFIKWQKKNPPVGPHAADQFKKYERAVARKNKIVGVKQLYEALGADNPYTFDTLNNIFSRAEGKITKNMSNVEKNYIKAGQRIKKIILDTLGEPTTLGEVQKDYKYIRGGTKTSPDKVWDLNESKLKQLNKALTKNYNVTGFRPSTIKTIFELADNKELMKAVDAYTGGKIPDDSLILKAVLQGKKTGDISNAYMILGDIKRGKIQMEGISKDLKRGNRIIKTLGGDGMKGPLGVALLKWAKLQMAKDFDNPKATYEGLTTTIRNAFEEVGIKNIAIDEIFPARTGQLTLGKGSGVYNQIVQFIDRDINSKEKIKFDAGATKRYKAIIEARKGKNPNWARVNQLVENHKTAIDKWYVDNPQAKGKVKLTQLDYNPKTHKFASPTKIYGKGVLPSKIEKRMKKFHRKTGLSLDVGSTMTLEKAAADIKKNPIKFFKDNLIKLGCGMYAGGRVGFKVGSGKCITRAVAKLKSGNLTAAEKKIVDALGDGLGKGGGMPKKGWTMKSLVKGEGYFALADFANNLTKGQSLDKSASNAVKAATFGLLDLKGTERDLMKYAKERGIDPKDMKEWMDYAKTYGKYVEGHEDVAEREQIVEASGGEEEFWKNYEPNVILNPSTNILGTEGLWDAEHRIKKAEEQIKEQEKAESIQSGKGYEDLNEMIEGVVANEWNKTAGTPLDRGYRKMLGMKGDEGLVWGPIGNLFREGLETVGVGEHDALKGFKPQTVMNYHPVYGYKEDIKDVIREGDSPMEDMLMFAKKYYPRSGLVEEALRTKKEDLKEKEKWVDTGFGREKRKVKTDMGTYDYDRNLYAQGGIASLLKK
jgi:hypothetical protein